MTAKQLMLPAHRAFDSDGAPEAGATAHLFLSGTLTPALFYSDATLLTSIGSVITANEAGRFDPMPYQDSSTAFRIIINDSEGTELDDIDPFYFGLVVGVDGVNIPVKTRTALAAVTSPADGDSRYLSESGREGVFVFRTANHATKVAADTLQGLYVAPASDVTGASGAWVRKFTRGLVDFLWFGALADMTANGVGTNNTPMFDAARTAMIAASHSHLHIPQQSAAYRFSTAPAVMHDGICITGDRHFSNPGQVGATTYVGIQIYNGTVLGFAADVPGFKMVAYTDNASNSLAFEYQSSTGSAVKDLILYSEGGTGTTSHGIETFVKTDLENLRVVGFAGNGVKLSGDDSGTANQYGNTVNSNVTNVYCTSNKLHGFRVTGNNGSAIQFTDCASQSNGGVGFLDQGPFGNSYTGCLAASNNASFGTPAGYSAAQRTQVTTDYAQLATQLNGSFVCTGAVAASTYTGCYVEVGNGSYPDLSYACSIHGGQLASYVWQFNVNSNGYTTPTSSSSRGLDTNTVNLSGGPSQGQSAIALNNARIYWGADRGLTLQGAPSNVGNYDVSIINKNDAAVMQVNTGTTTARFLGVVEVDFKNILLNGASAFPGIGITSQSVMFTSAVNGLNLAGWGSSYDVVLGNKTNQIALRVPTGTQNVEMPGNLTVTGTAAASNLSGTNTGDGAYTIQTKITGYTATETTGDIIVKVDLAAGFTVVLPTAVGNKARFTFKKIQAAGAIIIDANAAETIDGGLTATLNNQNESITIVSDNANWLII